MNRKIRNNQSRTTKNCSKVVFAGFWKDRPKERRAAGRRRNQVENETGLTQFIFDVFRLRYIKIRQFLIFSYW